MKTLTLKFKRITGPGDVWFEPPLEVRQALGSRGRWLYLEAGETAESRAMEAAQALCAAYNSLGGPTVYQPASDYSEGTEERYLERAQAAPKIMARWAAYNDRKLASGEWSVAEFNTFMQQVGPVVILLQSLAFGACRDAINAFNHTLATAQAKADYINIMMEEYPSLSA